MAFFVVLRRTGPQWDPTRRLEEQVGWDEHAVFMDDLVDRGFIVIGGPLADEVRVVLAVEANSEEDVRATLAEDPWSDSLLLVDAVEPWTIRLDGRGKEPGNQVVLELRPNCELCDKDLPPEAQDAMICSYECTFCAACVNDVLHDVCPNCGGSFAARPIRPAGAWRERTGLKSDPPGTRRRTTHYTHDEIAAFSQMLRDVPPERR